MIIPKLVLMNAHGLANRLVLRLPLPEAKGLEGLLAGAALETPRFARPSRRGYAWE